MIVYISQYITDHRQGNRSLDSLIELYHYCQNTGLPVAPGGAMEQPYLLSAVIFPAIKQALQALLAEHMATQG